MKRILFLLPVIFLVTTGRAEDKKLWAKSYLNQKAPDLVVEKWISARPDLKGKYVLIDFWATWCGPCRKAVPELNKFHEKFRDKLVVIGLSDESEETIRNFNKPALRYFSAIDTQSRTAKKFEVKGIPHCVILDPEGYVRWEGYPFLEGHELTEEVIQSILARK